jgi:DNA-binding transcriptional ArsR family regulator
MRTIDRSLIDVLMPQTRQAILAATLLQPDHVWYAADLARHLGSSRSSLQRELAALLDVGILKSRREGRMVFIQADVECPIFPELHGLLSKTAGLVDVLRGALTPFLDQIQVAFVYGSIARAQETSTIDLFIIGEVGLRELAGAVHEAQLKIGREVSPRIYQPQEIAKRLAAHDHFVLSVLTKPKLFVLGTQRELDQFDQRQPSDRRTVE